MWINLSRGLCCFNCPAVIKALLPLHFLSAISDFPNKIFICSFSVLTKCFQHTWPLFVHTVLTLIYKYHYRKQLLIVLHLQVIFDLKIFLDKLILPNICLLKYLIVCCLLQVQCCEFVFTLSSRKPVAVSMLSVTPAGISALSSLSSHHHHFVYQLTNSDKYFQFHPIDHCLRRWSLPPGKEY